MAAIVHRKDWLGWFAAFDNPNLLDMMRYALGSAFTNVRGHDYDPFLWTMSYELWGSLAVLLICWWERTALDGYVALGLATLLAAMLFPMAVPVPLGALLARLARGGILAPNEGRGANIVGLLLIFAGLAQFVFMPVERFTNRFGRWFETHVEAGIGVAGRLRTRRGDPPAVNGVTPASPSVPRRPAASR